MSTPHRYIVALCGASGSIYGIRLVKALAALPCEVLFMASPAGLRVLALEAGYIPGEDLPEFLAARGVAVHPRGALHILNDGDIGGGPASGSFRHQGMVVAPCSMKSLARIASGLADSLIARSADVCLKERRPLILLPRETPLSLIHLENMTRACRAGAVILPPSPSFYSGARTPEELADTVVSRVLDHLKVEHDLSPRWEPGLS